ncbi:MAG TPA: xanthine dehydrogenase family protein subunit M, partial [Candidatus Limnocylindria bacterium]|nr:xanthine dehydrogenase family protein subunit M [Candidatus Limnocylindria bacterium]
MSFTYHEPTSVDEALALLERHGEDAHVVAGATSFTLLWRQGLLRPAHVVGLRRIEALRGIERTRDGLVIGATASHREVELSPLVREFCPALARAFGSVATVRVRNQATVGGNLAHADPAQDPPPMLIALGAEVAVAGRAGERRIAAEDLFVDVLTTSLEPGEIITAVHIPAPREGTRAAYEKFLPRTQDDYATVSVGAALRLDDAGVITDVRIALGSVGPTPRRARAVEDAVRGKRVD